METISNKICTICGIEKNIQEFSLRKDSGRYRNQCKECRKKQNREYAEKNKEKIKLQKQKYRQEHLLLYKQQRHNAYVRYYEKNKEEINKKRRQQYKEDTNNQHIKQQRYHLKRKTEDENYNIKRKLRSIILNSLKRGGYEKDTKTFEILKADFKEVKNHLLQTFKNNYGYEWDGVEEVHIDHIIPLSSTNKKNEIIKLCHYTNLQLLKAKDNLSKGNKINWKLEAINE